MDTKLRIKFYSQHSDEIDIGWRLKSCGIACVKMTLLYFLPSDEKISTMKLINECKYIGGYSTEFGWSHDALVILLRNRGIPAYRQEFRSQTIDPVEKKSTMNKFQEKLSSVGTHKIIQSLEKGSPVIVSVKEGFDTNTSTHLILLSGFKVENKLITGFFYFDPNKLPENGKEPLFLSLDKFHQFWRKLAIFTA